MVLYRKLSLRFSILTIFIALLVITISCNREKNWFANGGFEQGNLSSWGVESAREMAIEVTSSRIDILTKK